MGDDLRQKRPTRRFSPSWTTERLVPIILGVLAVGLIITLVIVLLAIFGLTPVH